MDSTLSSELWSVSERTAGTRAGSAHYSPVSPLKAALYQRALEGAARLLRTPPYLILFVTDRCWMRCSHCWFDDDWKRRELVGPALSFDEYARLSRSIRRVAFLSITGGEAFLRPDIVELVCMFRRNSGVRRFDIPTSGFDTDRVLSAVHRILAANPDTPFRVDVSLDGVSATHDRIRGVAGGHASALATIAALGKLRRSVSRFDVGVITTVSRANQAEVDAIHSQLRRVGHEGEWMVNIARGRTRDPRAGDVDVAAYRAAHALLERRLSEGNYGGHAGHRAARWLSAKNIARREIILDILAGRRRGGGCTAGALAAVIQVDGSVRACEMSDEPLGNVRDFDYDLAALWRGERARQIRRCIQTSGCHCTQECFLSTTMLVRPGDWRRMLAARLRLGR